MCGWDGGKSDCSAPAALQCKSRKQVQFLPDHPFTSPVNLTWVSSWFTCKKSPLLALHKCHACVFARWCSDACRLWDVLGSFAFVLGCQKCTQGLYFGRARVLGNLFCCCREIPGQASCFQQSWSLRCRSVESSCYALLVHLASRALKLSLAVTREWVTIIRLLLYGSKRFCMQ